MISRRRSLPVVLVSIVALAGCATSPEVEERRAAILPLKSGEHGAVKRCLSQNEFRSFRALDDRHILFIGRADRRWLNTLRSRCPDLRYGHVLVTRPFSGTRICDLDRFEVADWFAWPWYRRWPWTWGTWGTGMACTFGQFQAVSEAQVDEIENLLENY